MTEHNPRCLGVYKSKPCGKLLARQVSDPWVIECPRCGWINKGDANTTIYALSGQQNSDSKKILDKCPHSLAA